ncbi:hypothetical protein ALC60_08854, partial [Trachymyrmex zeteki]
GAGTLCGSVFRTPTGHSFVPPVIGIGQCPFYPRRGASILSRPSSRKYFNINGKSQIHFNVCSRTEWEWRSIKRQLATALMSLYEMAKMQHNDASNTLTILFRKYIINFTLWHEIALSSNNDHQGLHISPLVVKEPAGLAGNLSEFELQFRGV